MSTEELSASDSEAAFAGERWAPVGAVASPEDEGDRGSPGRPKRSASSPATDEEMAVRLEKLEEEQHLLNSSLLALTSHFAQVQFRLKQVVHAQAEEKERMLAELEEFAFRGCPHVVGCRTQDAGQLENSVRPRVSLLNVAMHVQVCSTSNRCLGRDEVINGNKQCSDLLLFEGKHRFLPVHFNSHQSVLLLMLDLHILRFKCNI